MSAPRPVRKSSSDASPDALLQNGVLSSPRLLTEARVDEALGPHMTERTLWAVRPRLTWIGGRAWSRLSLSAPTVNGGGMGRLRRTLSRVGRFHSRSPMLAEAGISSAIREGVLRVWTTENHRVALGSPIPTSFIPLRWSTDSREPRDALRRPLRDLAGGAGLPSTLFDAALNRALEEDVIARRLLDEQRPRLVVVASLEHSLQRLLVWHARNRNIASAYVPHAPTSLDRCYADLPVDVVLCHGTGDVDHYRTLGARGEAFHVTGGIGFPTRTFRGRGHDERSSIVALATTAMYRFEDLSTLLLRSDELVRSHGLTLVVSPHPRERAPVLRLAESLGIRTHHGRTSDLLETGVGALLAETASGSLLEAAIAGTPNAHLTGVSGYAFMPDLGSHQLDESFLAGVTSWSNSSAEALARRSEAWAAASGQVAVRRIDAVLSEDWPVGPPALDSWHALS